MLAAGSRAPREAARRTTGLQHQEEEEKEEEEPLRDPVSALYSSATRGQTPYLPEFLMGARSSALFTELMTAQSGS